MPDNPGENSDKEADRDGTKQSTRGGNLGQKKKDKGPPRDGAKSTRGRARSEVVRPTRPPSGSRT